MGKLKRQEINGRPAAGWVRRSLQAYACLTVSNKVPEFSRSQRQFSYMYVFSAFYLFFLPIH